MHAETPAPAPVRPMPDPGDLAWLRRFRRSLAQHAAEVADLVSQELGKPPFETMTSEIIPLLASCRWHERHARRVLGPRRPLSPGVRGRLFTMGQTHRIVRAPLGRVAIIATWNYPVQLLGVQLVQALVAGNRVCVKPSERSPRTQGRLLDLAREAAPPEVGPGPRLEVREAAREAGERMLADETFDHVVFTGSTAVGRSIAGALAGSLTPSTLELSGSDSAIVLDGADVDLAARSIAFAFRLNAGQTCMAPRRVLVVHRLYEPFCAALARSLAAPGERTVPRPDQAAGARAAAEAAVAGGGGWLAEPAGPAGPFVVRGCPVDSALFRGEHFGPAMGVVEVGDESAALRLHASVGQKLATSVFAGDARRARSLAAGLGSSVVTVNDCLIPTGHPGVGLAGVGPSGWGVSRGAAGLEAMTRPVFVSSTGRRVRTPTDDPGESVKRSLAGVIRRLYG